jgi:hypothetical protein
MFADVASSYEDILKSVFSAPIAAKAWLATFAAVLAVVQIVTAARIYGKLEGVLRLPAEVVSTTHRWSGRLAVLFTLPVVFHCIFILGFQTGDTRVALHSAIGSFFYGAVATKVFIVRNHAYPGWVLPVAGGTLFSMLAVLWVTSSLWYFTEVRFGL